MCDFEKILAPKEICEMAEAFLNETVKQLNIDFDIKGCSYKCEYFTVCDVNGNCRRKRVCWWQCTGKKIMLPKEICNKYDQLLERAKEIMKIEIDLDGCSYKCEWFTVCDANGNCKRELVCWWQCTN
ncbi:hypothetical protein P8625_01000 [Tenacibaculum tangerinum]|uniref:Uncharacterized protein n=1 Tax=Tenacibaculum tangerinum TaxID=3038772 RepID=A0ABY8L3D4_9FLAO|nr:hypothetical protein [Tenacibaculum tangerinum]WGH75771.1 hypothetical protein P8625_01000 [Tenacibaculum tangerinum]